MSKLLKFSMFRNQQNQKYINFFKIIHCISNSWVKANFITEIRKYIDLINNKENFKSCGMQPKKFSKGNLYPLILISEFKKLYSTSEVSKSIKNWKAHKVGVRI